MQKPPKNKLLVPRQVRLVVNDPRLGRCEYVETLPCELDARSFCFLAQTISMVESCEILPLDITAPAAA